MPARAVCGIWRQDAGAAPHPDLCPQAGRGDWKHAASPFSPPAGRRCRQADEGQRTFHQRQFT
ncbi:hypothetical protein CN204_35410 [Sinorhizobium meliloti]|nr:hypothetical protein CN217_33040 [Sinorhizobium meliloti]RVH73821.1 hypothetical protein CN204_35410 [Sinorhizobium meliloti]RVN98045.1 hypothetical protein CN102_35070 [Sinorhizobium meliloti]